MSTHANFHIGRRIFSILAAIKPASRPINKRMLILAEEHYERFFTCPSAFRFVIMRRLRYLAECVAAKLSPSVDGGSNLPYPLSHDNLFNPSLSSDQRAERCLFGTFTYRYRSYFGVKNWSFPSPYRNERRAMVMSDPRFTYKDAKYADSHRSYGFPPSWKEDRRISTDMPVRDFVLKALKDLPTNVEISFPEFDRFLSENSILKGNIDFVNFPFILAYLMSQDKTVH